MPAIIAIAAAAIVAQAAPAIPAKSPAKPASPLRIEGSIRARLETIAGQARVGANADETLINLRSTLLAEYKDGPIRIGGEVWDSRVTGANAGTPLTTGEVNTLELVQAYVGADVSLGKGTRGAVQAGRFVLNLGSRRLVAADDYRNTTNGYTGLRADLATRSGVKATLIYTLPQMRRPDDLPSLLDNRVARDRESFDLVLWGGVASKARLVGQAMGELSFFHLGERDAPGRPTRNRSLDTIGARVIREPAPDASDLEVEGFAQWGTIRTGLAADATVQPVRAWFVHADVGHSLATRWAPRVSFDLDIASGDRPGGRYGRFDTLLGMRRADLAPSGLYNAIGRANLISPGIRVEVAPDPRLDGFVSVRPFWLASASDAFSTTGVRDITGGSGRYAGTQLDSRVRYWLKPGRLRFEFDAVLLAKGRFLRDAPNAPPGRVTRYLSWNLTATL